MTWELIDLKNRKFISVSPSVIELPLHEWGGAAETETTKRP